jgi:hypothetical protein
MKGENQTKEILIEGALKTLEVAKQGNKIYITGSSVPDNSIGFFKIVFEKIKTAIKDLEEITFEMQIEYFNVSSSKCLRDLFLILEEETLEKEKKINIVWKYEEDDEDMLEAGEDYQALTKLPFELVCNCND